ncbi:MAG: histidine phosphatase family protein [Oscillospiraceae bacterium]|nr:histidine phosphatase family protein [Oscillospiraceae bacterium]
MTKVYIVRHCEARGNIDRVFHGITDSDISENGQSQLDCLAERFKNIELNAVYTSPLKRTRLTAEAVNKYHGLPINIDSNLIEINGGVIEGLPWKELPEKYPEFARQWNLAPHEFVPENGEAMSQVYRRGLDSIRKIAQQQSGKTVAVVSHGCVIRNIICRAQKLSIDQLNTVEWCDNTAVTMLEFDDEFNCNLVFFNDASHLSEDLSTLSKQSWWQKDKRNNLEFD